MSALRWAARLVTRVTGVACLLLPIASSGQSVSFESSNLPIILIDTGGQPIPDEPKLDAYMMAVDNGPRARNGVADPPNAYDGFIGIELRGSTSRVLFDKKSYAFETRNADGSNRNVELLGLPRENDWVLHGPFSDKSLIRNSLLYELYRSTGRYASASRFCEVVIDGDYRGVYLLLEKVKRDGDRVDIADLVPSDTSGDAVTGGYMIKVDKSEGSEVGGWYSNHPTLTDPARMTFYQYHFPKPSEITPEQKAYIRSFFDEFEDAMAAVDFADREHGYPSILDLASAVDYILFTELSGNVDAYRLSTFMYKDRDSRDGRLVLGPPWDYNIALGNANYYDGERTSGFRLHFPLPVQDGFHAPFWWGRLVDDPAFVDSLTGRWSELRQGPFRTDRVLARIDSLSSLLSEAQSRNFARWSILDNWIWPNVVVTGTYGGEVNYVRSWIQDRLDWLDARISTIGGSPAGNGSTIPLERFHTSVFPNPAANSATLTIGVETSDRFRIAIVDVTGREVRLVYSGPVVNDSEHRFKVDVSSLSAGMYFIFVNGTRHFSTETLAVIH